MATLFIAWVNNCDTKQKISDMNYIFHIYIPLICGIIWHKFIFFILDSDDYR